jgi:hypothetical protein
MAANKNEIFPHVVDLLHSHYCQAFYGRRDFISFVVVVNEIFWVHKILGGIILKRTCR